MSALAALHFAGTRPTILFTTDPASNLSDLLGADDRASTPDLTVVSLDADALYRVFLERNLESFLEIGDRGTYLGPDELRRFFELSIPGIDELMAWSRIGELVEENPQSLLVVDTAPTGHTLRMLSAAEHFQRFATALDALQEKRRGMMRQFTRREVRDAIDAFIEDFDAEARRRRELLTDPARTGFVPVLLSEPWVVEQTHRLMAEVRAGGIDIPFAILNRAVHDRDCASCRERVQRDDEARAAFGKLPVVAVKRSCVPLDSLERVREYL